MIMVNYADLWLVHSQVASLLDSARLELKELKARSTLLGVCTTCPLLRSDLNVTAVEIKDLKHKLDHSSRYTVLSPPCEACVSLEETHIVMSSLISCLVLILVFRLARTLVLRLALFHVLCLSSLMDLTIAHMVLVHERTALSLDALVTAHVLVVVIVSCVGLVFLLEGPSPTLS
jgi:hypothetical protein